MLIRREEPSDVDAVREVHAEAFATPETLHRTPVEVGLVDALRASDAWIPRLSFVATDPAGLVIGHVVCSRARVGGTPALGLGPLGVRVAWQRRGVGSSLMHTIIGAADALDEPVIVLLGHTTYYPRFGFRPALDYGITAPVAQWGAHFQCRTLNAFTPAVRGEFAYATPFAEL